MDKSTRIKLGMAGGALVFCQEHADGDPAIAPVADRLGILIKRSDDLLAQHRRALTAGITIVDDKITLRVAIEEGMAALGGIARTAAKTVPGISIHRRLPRPHASELTLVTNARVAVGEATANKDKLVPFGLDDAMLQALSADVAAYGAAMVQQRKALAEQVGAAGDLKEISSEIISVVKNLDALYRIRYKKNTELRLAWKTARKVHWQSPREEVADPVPIPTPPAAAGESVA
jgi:hypothetical protein